MSMWSGGQTERHCGKVGARSNELAPVNDSPGVYTAGQGHGRCCRMRIFDQISALYTYARAHAPHPLEDNAATTHRLLWDGLACLAAHQVAPA